MFEIIGNFQYQILKLKTGFSLNKKKKKFYHPDQNESETHCNNRTLQILVFSFTRNKRNLNWFKNCKMYRAYRQSSRTHCIQCILLYVSSLRSPPHPFDENSCCSFPVYPLAHNTTVIPRSNRAKYACTDPFTFKMATVFFVFVSLDSGYNYGD